MGKKVIKTEKAPAPNAFFSQAIVYGNLLFVSGQGAVDPKTQNFKGGSIEEQARLSLANLKNVIEDAGFLMQTVIKVTVFLADMDDFAGFNQIYNEFFPKEPPARTVFQAGLLPGRKCVVDAIAGK